MPSAIETFASTSAKSAKGGAVWSYIPAIGLAVAGLVFCARASLSPTDPLTVTAIFAPWWSEEAMFLAASRHGAILGVGPRPYLITVRGTDTTLARRLRASGAIAVVSPSNPLICGTTSFGGSNAK